MERDRLGTIFLFLCGIVILVVSFVIYAKYAKYLIN